MTTTDFAVGTGDGNIRSYDQDAWATARSTSGLYDIAANLMVVGSFFNGSKYRCHRAFILFDTSGIGADQTVTQVNLSFVPISDNSATDFDLQIVKYDWSQWAGAPTNTTYRETAYDGCLVADADDSTWRNTSGISINTKYTSGNLDPTWINKTGITYYGLRSSRDANNDTPTGLEHISIASANHATAAYRPVLTVTYSVDLTALDLTLAAVAFDAPTLVNVWVTPACRTFTVPAESRAFVIEKEMRGLKILCNSVATYQIAGLTYNGLTALDLTLSAPTFDA